MTRLSVDSNESKVLTTSVKCPTFLEDLQCLLSHVVSREESLGLHNIRKTPCIMRIIGNGNPEDLHERTRHKSAE